MLQVVESRVKTDWGEQGTGGAKGQTYKGPSSFEVRNDENLKNPMTPNLTFYPPKY